MSKRDIRLCYKKHTTSKILNSDDLLRLNTEGFRGEALSSIGSVSKMIISSTDNKKGIRNVLNIENGQNVEETEESGLNPSSCIASKITDLLYKLSNGIFAKPCI